MRPSESAMAIANVSFDWVVIAFAFFLFDLTRRLATSTPWQRFRKKAAKEKARFEPGPHRVGGWQGSTSTRRLLLSTSSLHSGYALNREGVLYARPLAHVREAFLVGWVLLQVLHRDQIAGVPHAGLPGEGISMIT